MKLLFCGDVVGRAGREAVKRFVPPLRQELALDAVVVNVDNAAGGFGVTADICRQFRDAGVDVMTSGDHVWDQKDAAQTLEQDKALLRPHNFPEGTPGTGCRLYTLKNGKTLLVLHLLGQIFHKEYLDSPFRCAQTALHGYSLGATVDFILVDMHAEATSEKNAIGVFLDGKVSAVVGSHTHVPTADARILRGGTAYQTDTGMCGNYDNTVIGFAPEAPIKQFLSKIRKIRMEPATGNGTLSAVLIETDDATGLAMKIEAIRRQ